MMPRKIEISHRTIIFAVFFILFLWLVWYLRSVIVLLFFGIILMAALNPLVDRLERWHIPRVLSIVVIYILIIGALSLVVAGIIPPLVEQTQTLLSRLPSDFDPSNWLGVNQKVVDSQVNQFLEKFNIFSGGVIKTIGSIFQNILNFIIFIVISFYLLLQRKNLDKFLVRFLGSEQKVGARIVDKIEKRLGGWVRAELLLMLIVGLLSYIGLRLLGIEYALPLAIFAGVLEIIPNIGPFISAIPAVLAGLILGPWTALAVAALYFLIQQFENQFIVPQIMAKEVGINPLVVILSLIAGFKLAGVVGAILAVPVVLLIEIILSEVSSSGRFKRL